VWAVQRRIDTRSAPPDNTGVAEAAFVAGDGDISQTRGVANMAYVPSVAHDVFVSYAHLDNLAPEGRASLGWVDLLLERLTVQLKKRVGSGAIDIWIDHELAGNRPLTPEILNAARDSALLLVVMSPAYLQSEWCARERNAFLDVARDRVADGRIFIVRSLDENLAERPAEFGDLTGYPFFVDDPRTGVQRSLGEADPSEPEFLTRIFGLSTYLARELNRLKGAHGAPSVLRQAAGGNGPRVFVARATDDLEDREEEFRNCLAQGGITAQPRRQYIQADAAAFEAAVRADLEASKLFVQLLSTARGPEAPFGGGKRLPLLQWEVAERIGKKMMLWRDRSIDPGTIANPDHRRLVESAIACPIEEFKQAVGAEARREPPPAPARTAGVMVFVDSELRDQSLARELGKALAGQGVACYWPLDKGSPEDVRKDLEANLRDCDGVVIVYGASEPSWVREQVRFGTKVFRQRSNRPALAICQGPPPDKSELGMLDPDMLFLDCSGGFVKEALRPFVERLRSEGVA
jgi:hypothetical protein